MLKYNIELELKRKEFGVILFVVITVLTFS
jgi:hypothetical protein